MTSTSINGLALPPTVDLPDNGPGPELMGVSMELDGLNTRTESNTYAAGVRAGLLAMSPLLVAIPPFAVAMAVAAHAAGFNPLEIVLMSAFVFAGAAQMAAISLYASGAGLLTIVLTTLLINLRHVIYGLSLDRHLPSDARPSRPVLAFLLIDEAYGLSVAHRPAGVRIDAFYLGVSLGMYLAFVVFTGIGAMFASLIPEIGSIGLDFIFPLAFVGLLMPLLKGRKQILIALVSGSLTLMLMQVLDPGISILLAMASGAAVGAFWKGDE